MIEWFENPLPDYGNDLSLNETLYNYGKTLEVNAGGTTYGNYFLYNYNELDYDVALYVNTSSRASLPAFGNFGLQQIARSMSNKPNLEIEFIQVPLPLNAGLLAS
jgi:hypothetical protein